jgi:hypothetical protein
MTLHISESYPLDSSLNWDIISAPVFSESGQPVPGFQLLSNSETGEPIAVHRNSYTPVSNERLVNMVNKMLDMSNFSLQGFHTYNGGAKVMAYLKNNNPKKFGGHDANDFMILGNSHDGSSAFFSGMTNYIFRCKNMFAQHHQQNKIWHTKNADAELRSLEKTHDLYYNEVTGVYEMADRMADTILNAQDYAKGVQYIFDLPNLEDLPTVTKNRLNSLNTCIIREAADLGNNAFALFNGVTRYTTHELRQKKRVFGNPLNRAYELNQRAYDFCERKVIEKKRTLIHI